MDVGMRKVFPERLPDVSVDVGCHANGEVLSVGGRGGFCSLHGGKGCFVGTWCKGDGRVEVVVGSRTLGASPLLGAGDETLLWIICHISSKYRVDDAKYTIAPGHLDTALASLDKGLEEFRHGSVKKALVAGRDLILRQFTAGHLLDGEIRD